MEEESFMSGIMIKRSKLLIAVGIAASAWAAGAGAAHAQGAVRSAQTDTRWYPWLGCWATDSAASRAPRGAINCVVPVSGNSGVDQLSLIDGRVVSRRRLDATGRPQPIDNQGCTGTQVTEWGQSASRVYMRAGYTCNTGIAGTSSSISALSSNAEWIQVEDIRGGSNANPLVNVDRLHDVGIPTGLPRDAAAALESRRLAINTSRAAAARMLTTDDVVDAMRHADATLVASWLAATGQHFVLSGQQINALAGANVPATVLQAMMGNPVGDQPGYVDSRGVPVYRGSAIYTEPTSQPLVYQPGTEQPVVAQPYVESNNYYYSEQYPNMYPNAYVLPYGSSIYNPMRYSPGLFYPFSHYPSYSNPRPIRTAPFVGVEAPRVSSPYHGNPAPQQPVSRGPAGRHRP
jgi:hypothetical protein